MRCLPETVSLILFLTNDFYTAISTVSYHSTTLKLIVSLIEDLERESERGVYTGSGPDGIGSIWIRSTF